MKEHRLVIFRFHLVDKAGHIVEAGVLHGALIAEYHVLRGQRVAVLEGGVHNGHGIGQAVLADLNIFCQQVVVPSMGLIHTIQALKYLDPQNLHIVD